MDEDNGQREADQITDEQMDNFYGKLADEMTRQRRIKNWLIAIAFILLGAFIFLILYGGG